MSINNKHTVYGCETIFYMIIIKLFKFQDFNPNYIEKKMKMKLFMTEYARICLLLLLLKELINVLPSNFCG